MAKLGELAGLSALETVAMSDFQANVLALHVQDALFKEAMRSPAVLNTSLKRAVRSRTARVVRSMREGPSLDSGIGEPPEE
jgi:hypothetical protein